MAGSTRLGILALQRPVKAGSVRIESPSPQGRVAGETVPLGMTGDAALEILSRRLAVAQEKRTLGIVESRLERSFRGESRA